MTAPHNYRGRWADAVTIGPWLKTAARELGVGVPCPSDPLFDRLRASVAENDPLADDLADWVRRGGAEAKALFNAVLDDVQNTIDRRTLPDALRRFTEAVIDYRPDWATPEALNVGCEAHLRLGRRARLASAAMSLMDGYRHLPSARILTMTGSLTEVAARRLAETAAFANDIITSRGLPRNSRGFKTALRVRLVHAFVRHGLLRGNSWPREEWGIPIPYVDSLGTAMGFWVPAVRAQRVMGHSVQASEAEGMNKLWNYVAFLQGVPESYLSGTAQETYAVYLCIWAALGEGDQNSVDLARSFFAVAERRLGKASWWKRKLAQGAMARLLSRSSRETLQIPSTPFAYHIDLMRPLVRYQDQRTLRNESARQAAIERGWQEITGTSQMETATFDPDKIIHDKSKLAVVLTN